MAKDEGKVDPEIDATTTGETVDTTEAGAGPAEAPHHKANDPAEEKTHGTNNPGDGHPLEDQ